MAALAAKNAEKERKLTASAEKRYRAKRKIKTAVQQPDLSSTVPIAAQP